MASEEQNQPQSDKVRGRADEGESHPRASSSPGPASLWARIKRHKVVEWSLAYTAFGYAALHGSEMLRAAFDWSELVPRITLFALLLGFPVAVTLAWYHGHRARQRISGPELLIVSLLLAVGGTLLWGLSRPRQSHSGSLSQPVPSVPAMADKSIAVLPFVDMSEKHDQEYFGDGMAEEILDLIGRFPQLKVIGRTSSFQFKGHNEDLRAVGEKLGVAFLLEGSVRKAGDRIRVAAQLIDTRSGSYLWTESYDREYGDVLSIQDQIAALIAHSLQIAVGANDTRPLRHLRNPEAYTLYLQARAGIDRGDETGLTQAIDNAERALALDPTFVQAGEALVNAHLQRVVTDLVPESEGWQRVKVAAERTLAIDANSAMAHEGLANYFASYQYNWSRADEELRRARALNGGQISTVLSSAHFAFARGQYEEARQFIDEVLAADPANPVVYQVDAWMRYERGDLAGAESAVRKSNALSPTLSQNHFILGVILLARDELQAALAAMNAEAPEGGRDEGLALVYQALGRKADADAALARFTGEFGNTQPEGVAEIYAARRDLTKAFEWLDKACTGRDAELLWAPDNPLFRPLHADPRWLSLLHKMNLPPRP